MSFSLADGDLARIIVHDSVLNFMQVFGPVFLCLRWSSFKLCVPFYLPGSVIPMINGLIFLQTKPRFITSAQMQNKIK